MRSVIEQLEYQTATLIQGERARIKYTGQIVNLKRVSKHGISVVFLDAGDDYFISNKFLEPVIVFH